MYEQLLSQANLSYNQAIIYEILLKEGPLNAGAISKKTPLKRGLTYKTLDELMVKGLVKKEEKPEQIALFEPVHPNKLRELIDQKEQQINKAKQNIDKLLPQLISEYNLSAGKPGIKFYEGTEGFKQVVDDSLRAGTEIYSYVDVEAVLKYAKKENEAYVKKRRELGKNKKIIVQDTEFNKKYFSRLGEEATDIRYISFDIPRFNAVMQMYDNKISYLTLEPKNMIGVIIEDSLISKMHRSLFEYTWSTAGK